MTNKNKQKNFHISNLQNFPFFSYRMICKRLSQIFSLYIFYWQGLSMVNICSTPTKLSKSYLLIAKIFQFITENSQALEKCSYWFFHLQIQSKCKFLIEWDLIQESLYQVLKMLKIKIKFEFGEELPSTYFGKISLITILH